MKDRGEIMKYGSDFSVALENKLLIKRLLQWVNVLNWRCVAIMNSEK